MAQAAAIIAAAGRGSRFGGPLPKVFVPLAGRPMLEWSLRAYGACERIDDIVLVVAAELVDEAWRIVEEGGHRSVLAVVAGGEGARGFGARGAGGAAHRRPGDRLCARRCSPAGGRPPSSAPSMPPWYGAAVTAIPARTPSSVAPPTARIEATPRRCDSTTRRLTELPLPAAAGLTSAPSARAPT